MKHNGSMLDPSMGELKAHINNRYLLVNVTAQLAREISQKAEEEELTLDNKPVTIALHEIADGEVVLVKDTPKEAVEEGTTETSEDLERAESVAVPEEETDSAEQEQL